MKLPGATDRVVTCQSALEARAAINAALQILSQLSVQLHPLKTRFVHVRRGFEFLGYLVRRGRQLQLPTSKIVTGEVALPESENHGLTALQAGVILLGSPTGTAETFQLAARSSDCTLPSLLDH